jgi:hypothetical protein
MPRAADTPNPGCQGRPGVNSACLLLCPTQPILQVLSGLRSLRLCHLHPVTITSVIQAVGGMTRLASLEVEGLSAGFRTSKVCGVVCAFGGGVHVCQTMSQWVTSPA